MGGPGEIDYEEIYKKAEPAPPASSLSVPTASEKGDIDYEAIYGHKPVAPVPSPSPKPPVKPSPRPTPTPTPVTLEKKVREEVPAPSPEVKAPPVPSTGGATSSFVGPVFQNVPIDDRRIAYENPGQYLSTLQQHGAGSKVSLWGDQSKLSNMTPTAQKSLARLAHSLKYSKLTDKGYTFTITSGYRPTSTTYHGEGNAVDIQIFKDGKMVGSTARPNWGDGATISVDDLHQIAGYAKKAGFGGIIDEIHYPTAHASGPHLHFAMGPEHSQQGDTGFGNLTSYAAKHLPAALRNLVDPARRAANTVKDKLVKPVRTNHVKNIARAEGMSPIDQDMFAAVVSTQSAGISHRNKQGKKEVNKDLYDREGLMSFSEEQLQDISRKYGVTPEDYRKNPGLQAKVGAAYFKDLLNENNGSWTQALAANALRDYGGTQKLQEYLQAGAPLPQEVRTEVAQTLTKGTGVKINPDNIDDMVRNPRQYDTAISPIFNPLKPEPILQNHMEPYAEAAGNLLRYGAAQAARFADRSTLGLIPGFSENIQANLGADAMEGPDIIQAVAGAEARAIKHATLGIAPLMERLFMGKVGDPNYQPWLDSWKEVEDAAHTSPLAGFVYDATQIAAMFTPLKIGALSLSGGQAAQAATSGILRGGSNLLGGIGGPVGAGIVRFMKSVRPAGFETAVAAGGFRLMEQIGTNALLSNMTHFSLGAASAFAIENFFQNTGRGKYSGNANPDLDALADITFDTIHGFTGLMAMSLVGHAALVGPLAGLGLFANYAPRTTEALTNMFAKQLVPSNNTSQLIGGAAVRSGLGMTGGTLAGDAAYEATKWATGNDELDPGPFLKAGAGIGALGGAGLTALVELTKVPAIREAMSNIIGSGVAQAASGEQAYKMGEEAPGIVKSLMESLDLSNPQVRDLGKRYFIETLKGLPNSPKEAIRSMMYDAFATAVRANRIAARSIEMKNFDQGLLQMIQGFMGGGAQSFERYVGQLKQEYGALKQQQTEASAKLAQMPYAHAVLAEQEVSQTTARVAQLEQMMQAEPKNQIVSNNLKSAKQDLQQRKKEYTDMLKDMSKTPDTFSQGLTQRQVYEQRKNVSKIVGDQLKEFEANHKATMDLAPQVSQSLQDFESQMMQIWQKRQDPAWREEAMRNDPYVYNPGSVSQVERKETEARLIRELDPELDIKGVTKDAKHQELYDEVQASLTAMYRDYFLTRGVTSSPIAFQEWENFGATVAQSLIDPQSSVARSLESARFTLRDTFEKVKQQTEPFFEVSLGFYKDRPTQGVSTIPWHKAPISSRKTGVGTTTVWNDPLSVSRVVRPSDWKPAFQDTYDSAYRFHVNNIDALREARPNAVPMKSFQVQYNAKTKKWDLAVKGGQTNPALKDQEYARLQATLESGDTVVPVVMKKGETSYYKKELSKHFASEKERRLKELQEQLKTLSVLEPFTTDKAFQPKAMSIGQLSNIPNVFGTTEEAVISKQVSESFKRVTDPEEIGQLPPAPDELLAIRNENGSMTYYKPKDSFGKELLRKINQSQDVEVNEKAIRGMLNRYEKEAARNLHAETAQLRDTFYSLPDDMKEAVVAKQLNDLHQMAMYVSNPESMLARKIFTDLATEAYAALDASTPPESRAAQKKYLDGLKSFSYFEPNRETGHTLQYLYDTEGSAQSHVTSFLDEMKNQRIRDKDVFGYTMGELPMRQYFQRQASWKARAGVKNHYNKMADKLSPDARKNLSAGMLYPERVAELVQETPEIREALAPMYHLLGELKRYQMDMHPDQVKLADARFLMSILPVMKEAYKQGGTDYTELEAQLLEDWKNPDTYMGAAKQLLHSLGSVDSLSLQPVRGLWGKIEGFDNALRKAGLEPRRYNDLVAGGKWEQAAELIPKTKASLDAAKAMPEGVAKEKALREVKKQVQRNRALMLADGVTTNPGELIAAKMGSVMDTLADNEMVRFFRGIKVIPDGSTSHDNMPDGIIHIAKTSKEPPRVHSSRGGKPDTYKPMSEMAGWRHMSYVDEMGSVWKSDQLMVHPDFHNFVENYYKNEDPGLVLKGLQTLRGVTSQAVLMGSPLPHFVSLLSNVLLEQSLNPLRVVGVLDVGKRMSNSEMSYYLQADAARSGLNIQTLENMQNLMASRLSKTLQDTEPSTFEGGGVFTMVPPSHYESTRQVPTEINIPGHPFPLRVMTDAQKLESPWSRPASGSIADLVWQAGSDDPALAASAYKVLSEKTSFNGLLPYGKLLAPGGTAMAGGARLAVNMDTAMNMAMLHKPIQQAALASWALKTSDLYTRFTSEGLPHDIAIRTAKRISSDIINRTAAVLPYYMTNNSTRNLANAALLTPDWFRNQTQAAYESFRGITSLIPGMIDGKKSPWASLPENIQNYVLRDAAKKFVMGTAGIVMFNQMVSFMTDGTIDITHPVETFHRGKAQVDWLLEDPRFLTKTIIGNKAYGSSVLGFYRQITRALTEFGAGGFSKHGATNLAPLQHYVGGQLSPAFSYVFNTLTGQGKRDPHVTGIAQEEAPRQITDNLRQLSDYFINSEEFLGTSSAASSFMELINATWNPDAPRMSFWDRAGKLGGVTSSEFSPTTRLEKRMDRLNKDTSKQLEDIVRKKMIHYGKLYKDRPEKFKEAMAELQLQATVDGTLVKPYKLQGDMDTEGGGRKYTVMAPDKFDVLAKAELAGELYDAMVVSDAYKENIEKGMLLDEMYRHQREKQEGWRKSMWQKIVRGDLSSDDLPQIDMRTMMKLEGFPSNVKQ